MSTYGISQCRLGIPASRAPCCNQCQKQLKTAIKRARHVGLLPFVG